MEQSAVAERGGGRDATRGGGGGGGGGGNGLPLQLQLQSSPGATMPSPPTRQMECDMSSMPDSPMRAPGHRRALSDMIGLPDDLDLGGAPGDGPSLSSDENEEELFSMFINIDKLNSPGGPSESESSCAVTGGGGGEATRMSAAPGVGVMKPRHHHSHSMDASSSITTEQLFGTPAMMEGMSTAEAKKAMSAAKLAELALIDPKKAKRIINNRQSAARSKERKMRYISELERKVEFMQGEATALSTQLALLQRDTAGLSAENNELKIRLQNMEHQVHLQDALNNALKSELQRLKVATGQMGSGGGMMNFGPFGGNQPMFHANQAMQPFMAMQQLPNAPLHPLQAQQMHQQAALGMNMRGLASAPSQVSWGEAWSESSSG